MFNVGVGELFVILLLALLVFGPHKLPEIARSLGKALRSFQQETEKATRTLRDAFEEPEASGRARAGVIDRPDPSTAAAPAAEGSGSPDGSPDAASQDEQLDDDARLLEDT